MNEREPRNFQPTYEGMKGESIPATEIKQLFEVQKKLQEFTEKDRKYRMPYLPMADYAKVDEVFLADKAKLEKIHGHPIISPQTFQLRHDAERHIYGKLEDTSRAVLSEVMTYLDSLPLWQYKFSTEYKQGRRQPWDWYNDSLYYVTPSGISLRLKKAVVREQGLAGVIQPPQEKVTFENKYDFNQSDSRPKQISTVPQIGWHVEEYQSEDFRQLMASGEISQDFPSHIVVVEHEDKPEVKTTGLVHTHSGHNVKEIFIAREA